MMLWERNLNHVGQNLKILKKKEAEGAQCRARFDWATKGEKLSKLFHELEKHNATQKYIPSLMVKTGKGEAVLINTQDKIEKETQNLYA